MITSPVSIVFSFGSLALAILLLAGCAMSHERPDCYRPAPDAGPGDGGEWAAVPPFDPGCRDWRAISPLSDQARPR